MSAMPYFDDFDLSTVDILLISQYVVIPLVPSSFESLLARIAFDCATLVSVWAVNTMNGLRYMSEKIYTHGLFDTAMYCSTDQYNTVHP